MKIDISAKITGIKYTPFLCRKLKTYNLIDFDKALSNDATFILKIDEKNQIAVSWWVSAKRTRSYPYSRVYDSLGFAGKKITVIPIFKDEGKEGDRDFLQWDTISLMSLLGVYVIIAYYSDAIPSSRYDKKITKQKYDISYLTGEIKKILSYQSDALHWNLSQIDKIGDIGSRAIESYRKISKKLNIEMHSMDLAEKRINQLKQSKDIFMKFSRNLAALAQKREMITIQPKEMLEGNKGMITISNYLGGHYFFTADEVKIDGNNIHLLDAKHTKTDKLPALEDIKDALLKMTLFTNLEDVKLDGKGYNPVAVLKMTTGKNFKIENINKSQKEMLEVLKKEAKSNGFKIVVNDYFIPH